MDDDGGGHRYGTTAGKSRRVLRELRGDIVAGSFAPGARLTEASLCARYGVSRVPVREALRTLAVQGFVEMRPNQGASVAVIPDDDADDLFTVRVTIEELTALRCGRRVAAGDGTPARLLGAIVDEGEAELRTRRAVRLPELNTRFHLTMAECSGSASLTALLRQVADRVEWISAMSVAGAGARSWAEHREIVEAIGAGDPGEAARRVRSHIDRTRDRFRTVH